MNEALSKRFPYRRSEVSGFIFSNFPSWILQPAENAKPFGPGFYMLDML
jgi:hypothetical protein